jgi:hypothetical protein
MGTLVRQLVLGAYQDDVAVEACVPKAGGDRVTCRTAAGDQGSDRRPSSS